jgi:hypothetical protein
MRAGLGESIYATNQPVENQPRPHAIRSRATDAASFSASRLAK